MYKPYERPGSTQTLHFHLLSWAWESNNSFEDINNASQNIDATVCNEGNKQQKLFQNYFCKKLNTKILLN